MSSIFAPPWLGELLRVRATLAKYTIDELVCEAGDVAVEVERTGHAFGGLPVGVYNDAITQEIEKRIKNAGKAAQNGE